MKEKGWLRLALLLLIIFLLANVVQSMFSFPNHHATSKFTEEQLKSFDLPKKRKDWKDYEWEKFRSMKGWKRGKIEKSPVDFKTAFKDAGVKPSVLSPQSSPLKVFNYFMSPIKEQLANNILANYTKDPTKYSSFISSSKPLNKEKILVKLDRFFAAHLEIRRQQRRAGNLDKWWSSLDKGGNHFIQQCLSRNEFKFIKYSMLAEQTKGDVEAMLDSVKLLTHAAIKLPLFVIVDECMVKARIHHLPDRVFMPNKPVKNGFKFWVLGASFDGLPIIWEFHQCKTDTEGSTFMLDTVQKLVSKLEEVGHVVIADRGFGSIGLADMLKKLGQYCILSCRSDRPTEVFSKGLDKILEQEDVDYATYVGRLSDGTSIMAGVYQPPNASEDSSRATAKVHCLTNCCTGEYEMSTTEDYLLPDFSQIYRMHFHDGPDQFDYKESLLRDPHKHCTTRDILFWWCFSVVLCNSYTIYCLLHKLTDKKKRLSIMDFLFKLREEMVPPCSLIVKRKPSIKRANGTVSYNKKCFVCTSKLGKFFNILSLFGYTAACDTYCERCRKWMHEKCQYFYHRHTSPKIPGSGNDCNGYEDYDSDV